MNKKIATLVLLLFVVIIWTLTINRFTTNVNKSNNIIPNTGKIKSVSLDKKLLKKLKILNSDITTSGIHDPFNANLYAGSYKKNSYRKKTSKIRRIEQPAYMLQGIVWDRNNSKAILIKTMKIGNNNEIHKIGETVIVQQGDKIDYGKVKTIAKNFVIISTKNIKFKLWGDKWIKIK